MKGPWAPPPNPQHAGWLCLKNGAPKYGASLAICASPMTSSFHRCRSSLLVLGQRPPTNGSVVRFKFSLRDETPPSAQIVAAGPQWNRDSDSKKRARRRQFDALDSKVVFAEPRIMSCVANLSVP